MYKFKCGDYCLTKVDNGWIKKGRLICINAVGYIKETGKYIYTTNFIRDFYYSENELELFM